MKIGIIECPEDQFTRDIISKLGDFQVEALTFHAQQAPVSSDYRVILDRLSFRYLYLKEIMKGLALSGTYVINNPYAATATNKLIDTRVFSRLGIPFPKTIILPDMALKEEGDHFVAEPNWGEIAEQLGLPCILKPFDGYAWEDVYVVNSVEEMKNLHVSMKSRHIMLAQRLIRYRDYYRVYCINKRDVLFIKWIPRPFAMGEYLYSDLKPIEAIKDRLAELTIQLNSALDLDVNVVEWCLDEEGQPWVIDAFNEVPEVRQESLPPDYYCWIVDKFVACIKDKLDPSKRNRTIFFEPALV